MCIYAWREVHVCRVQRTSWRSRVSPSTIRVKGIELRSLRFYLLSHLTCTGLQLLSRSFVSVFIREIQSVIFLFVVSLPSFGSRVILALLKEFGRVPSFSILQDKMRSTNVSSLKVWSNSVMNPSRYGLFLYRSFIFIYSFVISHIYTMYLDYIHPTPSSNSSQVLPHIPPNIVPSSF